MSGLEIESLRLTLDGEGKVSEAHLWGYRAIADAQLAKAVQGFRAWLSGWLAQHHPADECDGECVCTRREFIDSLLREYDEALEQANIERPTAGKV